MSHSSVFVSASDYDDNFFKTKKNLSSFVHLHSEYTHLLEVTFDPPLTSQEFFLINQKQLNFFVLNCSRLFFINDCVKCNEYDDF